MKIATIYITKEIFKKFFIVFLGLFVLFFVVDFFELTADTEIKTKIAFQISFYKIPSLLENMLHFILLIASLLTFYLFSNSSEIVVLRSSGMSIFQIIKLPLMIAFLFGVFVVFIYNPVASYLNMQSELLEKIYVDGDKRNLIISKNRIWFKQKNFEDDGTIILAAKQINKTTLNFYNVILLYMDVEDKFIKRIDVKTLLIKDGFLVAKDNYVFREGKKREFIDEIIIKTKLTRDFIGKTIQNEYEDVHNVPLLKLRSTIKNLKSSGFDTLRFETRFYSLLMLPFLFSIMILMAAIFGTVNHRDNKSYISLLYGVCFGFLTFIGNNIVVELANARKLTLSDNSLFLILFYVILSLILLMKKDVINNI